MTEQANSHSYLRKTIQSTAQASQQLIDAAASRSSVIKYSVEKLEPLSSSVIGVVKRTGDPLVSLADGAVDYSVNKASAVSHAVTTKVKLVSSRIPPASDLANGVQHTVGQVYDYSSASIRPIMPEKWFNDVDSIVRSGGTAASGLINAAVSVRPADVHKVFELVSTTLGEQYLSLRKKATDQGSAVTLTLESYLTAVRGSLGGVTDSLKEPITLFFTKAQDLLKKEEKSSVSFAARVRAALGESFEKPAKAAIQKYLTEPSVVVHNTAANLYQSLQRTTAAATVNPREFAVAVKGRLIELGAQWNERLEGPISEFVTVANKQRDNLMKSVAVEYLRAGKERLGEVAGASRSALSAATGFVGDRFSDLLQISLNTFDFILPPTHEEASGLTDGEKPQVSEADLVAEAHEGENKEGSEHSPAHEGNGNKKHVTVGAVVTTVQRRLTSRTKTAVTKANNGIKSVIKVDVIKLAEGAVENAKALLLPISSSLKPQLDTAVTAVQTRVHNLKIFIKEQNTQLSTKAHDTTQLLGAKLAPVASDIRSRLQSTIAYGRDLAKTVPGGATLVSTSDRLLALYKDTPKDLTPLLNLIHGVYEATFNLLHLTRAAKKEVELTPLPATNGAAPAAERQPQPEADAEAKERPAVPPAPVAAAPRAPASPEKAQPQADADQDKKEDKPADAADDLPAETTAAKGKKNKGKRGSNGGKR